MEYINAMGLDGNNQLVMLALESVDSSVNDIVVLIKPVMEAGAYF